MLKREKHFSLAVTIVIVIGAAVLGREALPVATLSGSYLAFTVRDDSAPIGSLRKKVMPVFSLAEEKHATRAGIGTLEESGILTVQLYKDIGPIVTKQSVPVLLQSDLRL